MTGEEMQRKYSEYVSDQWRCGAPASAPSWHQLSVQQQIAWEDLAAWAEKQIRSEAPA